MKSGFRFASPVMGVALIILSAPLGARAVPPQPGGKPMPKPGQPATPDATVVNNPATGAAATPGQINDVDFMKIVAAAPHSTDFPDAAKATLLDLSDIIVRPDGSTKTYVRQTLKIFNSRGRDEESEVKIPYNSTYETVTILRARTIKADGTIVPIKLDEPNAVRDDTVSDTGGAAMYTDAKQKSFSMPAVDNDSVIDYEYIIDQKEADIPGHFSSQWYFQSGLDPVKLTKLTVTIPKAMTLNQKSVRSSVKPTIIDLPDGKNVKYTWEDHDVAPIDIEPMMPSVDNVLPSLHISTIPSWQTVATWYYDLAKDREIADDNVKEKVAELTRGLTKPEDKAKAIYYWVEQKVRYVSLDFGKSAFQPHHASRVCSGLYGDCKDMATLLVTMLHEAGIKDAFPVLLQANSKDKASDKLPSPGAFDHAICLLEIDGKQHWLDATAEVCSWDEIPGGDRGAEVFVIRDGGKGEWQTIPDGTPDDNRTDQIVKISLNADGSATGSVTLSGTGDVDMGLRAALQYLPPDKLRPYMESIAQNIGTDPQVTNISLSEYNDLDKPVQIKMDVKFPAWANDSDQVLVFKARPEQSKADISSPFREDTRRLPIEQTSTGRTVSSLEVTLPTGYSILALPKDRDVKSLLGTFSRKVHQDGSVLKIQTDFDSFHVDVPAFQYADVRQYYKDYLRAYGQMVIVQKK